MTEICRHCNQEIPPSAVQQGQLIDGEWYGLHLGCFENWANELVEVWTITTDGYGYTGDKESVLSEIENLEEGEEITLLKWKMPRLKYLTLPEAGL